MQHVEEAPDEHAKTLTRRQAFCPLDFDFPSEPPHLYKPSASPTLAPNPIDFDHQRHSTNSILSINRQNGEFEPARAPRSLREGTVSGHTRPSELATGYPQPSATSTCANATSMRALG
jgi:hypothetical protein